MIARDLEMLQVGGLMIVRSWRVGRMKRMMKCVARMFEEVIEQKMEEGCGWTLYEVPAQSCGYCYYY